MPLIFVHGVNNRIEDPKYEIGRLVTESFLRTYLSGASINAKQLPVNFIASFPYWGDLATKFAWNMAALPSGEIDALGTPGIEPELRPLVALIKDALPEGSAPSDEPLVSLAQHGSFALAVELLCEVLSSNYLRERDELVSAFIVQAQTYAAKYASRAGPPWLPGLTTDMQFVTVLMQELRAEPHRRESLGVADAIANSLVAATAKLKQVVSATKTKILDSAGDFASTKALAWSRASLNAIMGRFFGDVFIYMHERGDASKPGRIPARLLQAWDDAKAARPNEPLVILGHSLGGVISFDLLSHFRPQLEVDLFISVGSQVSHFEEMKLFRASDPAIPSGDLTRRAQKPDNVKHWINVFDEVDIFSYACAKVFDNVQDFHYDTKTYVIKAHSAYFAQPRFYERLRARIDTLQQ